MSWALLLSKYPRSILTDKQPLLVLAMLDRAGLATESDLEQMAGDDLSELQQTLYKLQLNDLVEHGTNHVRLTESGRELLERLSLHEQVMDDVLDALAFRGKERKDFKRVLESYRSSSFRLYQNSLCTLRQWRSFSEDSPQSAKKNSTPLVQAGMRSLLLRDLRNWYMHSGVGSSLLDDMDESFRSVVLFDSSVLERWLQAPDETRNIMSVFLQTLVTFNLDREIEPAARLHDSGKWASLFQDFHRFQASWEPDIWFDKWIVECKHVKPRKHGSLDRYIGQLRSSLRQACNEQPEITDYTLAYFFDTWRPATPQESLTDNLLAQLTVALSISDLARRTNLPEASLIPLLEEIQDACKRLLPVRSGVTASDDSQVGSDRSLAEKSHSKQ